MPDAHLKEVAALVGSSQRLTHLTISNCQLSTAAGSAIAEGVGFATALGLPLSHLELQNNKLDSSVAHSLVVALRGNCRLIGLNTANNQFDAEAQAQLKEAKALVEASWRKTPEGKEAMKHNVRQKSGGSGMIGEMLQALG